MKMLNVKLGIIDEIVNQEGFVVDSDSKAEWAISKISEESEELNRIETICNEMIEKYKGKIAEATKTFENKTLYFKNQLQNYFETVQGKQTKTQRTYKLASGTLKTKFGGPEFIKDDLKLLSWCAENATDCIKTIEIVDWAELKKHITIDGNKAITADGEIVEGVTITQKADRFEIELGGI
jgi:phage host-nuclease inhibitor protein Gam